MDVVIDYAGKKFVLELKIWRRNAYNKRGEAQLTDHLSYFGLKQGYMLNYNFDKIKRIVLSQTCLGERLLIEAVV